jgi:hypothetical protein
VDGRIGTGFWILKFNSSTFDDLAMTAEGELCEHWFQLRGEHRYSAAMSTGKQLETNTQAKEVADIDVLAGGGGGRWGSQ